MKKNKQILLMAILTMVAGITLNLNAQKKVTLRYNLTQGDKYYYEMKMDQDIVFQNSGQSMALDQVIEFFMTTTVSKVTDSITLMSEIDRVVMNQKIFGMEMKYDSDVPAAEQNPMAAQIAEVMGALINKSYSMVMDNLGNVGKVDVSQITNNEDLANNLASGASFAIYPENPVAVGDFWEKDIEPIRTSDMKFHAKYTVLKLSGSEAVLQLDGTITANEMDDAEANMNLNGQQKGEITIDLKTGWLIKSEVQQNIKLDIEENGTKFPATIDGLIITTSSQKK
jgi:hypothetical protein